MGQTDRLMHRIHKIKRDTVCIESGKQNTRLVCDHAVHIFIIAWARDPLAKIFLSHRSHIGRVGLVARHDMIYGRPQCLSHPSVVFQNCRLVIPSGKT